MRSDVMPKSRFAKSCQLAGLKAEAELGFSEYLGSGAIPNSILDLSFTFCFHLYNTIKMEDEYSWRTNGGQHDRYQKQPT